MKQASLQAPPGFDNLSKSEQIDYLQALWDRISEQSETVPVPESHLQLAERRLRAYRRNPEAARPAFEVIEEIGKRHR